MEFQKLICEITDLIYLQRITKILENFSETDLETESCIRTCAVYFESMRVEKGYISRRYLRKKDDKFTCSIWNLLAFYGNYYSEAFNKNKSYKENLNKDLANLLKTELLPKFQSIIRLEKMKFFPKINNRLLNRHLSGIGISQQEITNFFNESHKKNLQWEDIKYVKDYFNFNANNFEELFNVNDSENFNKRKGFHILGLDNKKDKCLKGELSNEAKEKLKDIEKRLNEFGKITDIDSYQIVKQNCNLWATNRKDLFKETCKKEIKDKYFSELESLKEDESEKIKEKIEKLRKQTFEIEYKMKNMEIFSNLKTFCNFEAITYGKLTKPSIFSKEYKKKIYYLLDITSANYDEKLNDSHNRNKQLLEMKVKFIEDKIKDEEANINEFENYELFKNVRKVLQTAMEYENLRKFTDISKNLKNDHVEIICIKGSELLKIFFPSKMLPKYNEKDLFDKIASLIFFRNILLHPEGYYFYSKDNKLTFVKETIKKFLKSEIQSLNTLIGNRRKCMEDYFNSNIDYKTFKTDLVKHQNSEKSKSFIFLKEDTIFLLHSNLKNNISESNKQENIISEYEQEEQLDLLKEFLKDKKDKQNNFSSFKEQNPEKMLQYVCHEFQRLIKQENFKKISTSLKNAETELGKTELDIDFQIITAYLSLSSFLSNHFQNHEHKEMLERINRHIKHCRDFIIHETWRKSYNKKDVIYILGGLCFELMSNMEDRKSETLNDTELSKFFSIYDYDDEHNQILHKLLNDKFITKLTKTLSEKGAILTMESNAGSLLSLALKTGYTEFANFIIKRGSEGLQRSKRLINFRFYLESATVQQVKEYVENIKSKIFDPIDYPIATSIFRDKSTDRTIENRIDILNEYINIMSKEIINRKEIQEKNSIGHYLVEFQCNETLKNFIRRESIKMDRLNKKNISPLNLLLSNFDENKIDWLKFLLKYLQVKSPLKKYSEIFWKKNISKNVSFFLSLPDNPVRLQFTKVDESRFYVEFEENTFSITFDEHKQENLIRESCLMRILNFSLFKDDDVNNDEMNEVEIIFDPKQFEIEKEYKLKFCIEGSINSSDMTLGSQLKIDEKFFYNKLKKKQKRIRQKLKKMEKKK